MTLPIKPIPVPPPASLPQRGEPFDTDFRPNVSGLLSWHPDLTSNLNAAVDFIRASYTAIEILHSAATGSRTAAWQQAQLAQQQAGLADDQALQAINERGRAESEADRSESAAIQTEAEIGYYGFWESATGPGVSGRSYEHVGQHWLLINDLPDITQAEPGVSPAWIRQSQIPAAAIEVGQPVFSFAALDELPGGRYVLPGQVYLQAEYPALFAVVGLGSGDPPFDPATEFYVPDVPDREPVAVGDWSPSAVARAYVVAR